MDTVHYAVVCHQSGNVEISPPMQSFDEAYELYILWMQDFCAEALFATKWRGVFDKDDLTLALAQHFMNDERVQK